MVDEHTSRSPDEADGIRCESVEPASTGWPQEANGLPATTAASGGVGKLDHLPARQRSDVSDSMEESPWARKMMLCLDGGGIRGYSSLLILKRLMEYIKDIEQGRTKADHFVADQMTPGKGSDQYYTYNSTSAQYPWSGPVHGPAGSESNSQSVGQGIATNPASSEPVENGALGASDASHFLPHHYFDYIAGTSTGGLSAIMIGRLQMPTDSALSQYSVVGDRVFARPRMSSRLHKTSKIIWSKYRSSHMKAALEEVIGRRLEEQCLHGIEFPRKVALDWYQSQCRTMVMSLSDDERSKLPYIFRSYDHPPPSPLTKGTSDHLNAGRAHREPILKIARATSAAHAYFKPLTFSGKVFSDGALGANNPADLALEEVMQMHEPKPGLLLSLGTGTPDQTDPNPQVHEKIPLKLGVSYMAKQFLDGYKFSMNPDFIAKRVENKTSQLGIPYHRLTVRGLGKIEIDEWKPRRGGRHTLKKITDSTNEYLNQSEVQAWLLECAQLLVKTRRQRARTERWESFATDYEYFCPEEDCNRPGSSFSGCYPERKDLLEHGLTRHFTSCATAIENGETDKIACVHDGCAHQVHIFGNENELRHHLKTCHHGVQRQSDLYIKHWLDLGRRSRFDQRSKRGQSARNKSEQSPGPEQANGAAVI